MSTFEWSGRSDASLGGRPSQLCRELSCDARDNWNWIRAHNPSKMESFYFQWCQSNRSPAVNYVWLSQHPNRQSHGIAANDERASEATYDEIGQSTRSKLRMGARGDAELQWCFFLRLVHLGSFARSTITMMIIVMCLLVIYSRGCDAELSMMMRQINVFEIQMNYSNDGNRLRARSSRSTRLLHCIFWHCTDVASINIDRCEYVAVRVCWGCISYASAPHPSSPNIHSYMQMYPFVRVWWLHCAAFLF